MSHDIESLLSTAQQHYDAKQFDQASDLLRQVLEIAPENGEALEGLGYIAARQGDHASAADYLVRASEHMAMLADQLLLAAKICQRVTRHADAVMLLERLLNTSPDNPAALHAAALSLMQLSQLDSALEKLTRLCKTQPRSAEALYNLGTLYGTLGRHADEIQAYQKALTLNPRFVLAHVNLGVALRDQGRFDKALQQFKKALTLDPNQAGARTNRAQTNLLLGNFEHGWREYEWRWRDGVQQPEFPSDTLWNGKQAIAGKTLLVHHEQGFGDTLQFVRFVDRLSAAGAHVVLRVQGALLPLVKDYPGAAEVIGETATVPAFDFHIPLLSLPFALSLRAPDLAMSAPYLHADPQRVAQWDEVFATLTKADAPGASSKRPKIGLAWSGSRTHLNDRQRSLALDTLTPLLEADADFFTLQTDIRDSDRATLCALVEGGLLHDVSAKLGDFADTAALIAQLDLVISVDTAVVHLAGAMGKPVWVALPHMPDWRWQLKRSDSPWYDQARLYRQAAPQDWAPVVAALRADLDALPRQ